MHRVEAATLLSDNFNSENGGNGSLNYNSFANFDVSNGTVDLIGNGAFDFLPGNGLYIDLDGSTSQAGLLASKSTFSLTPGTYSLNFDLAGSQRGSVEVVTVSLGSVYSEVFTLASSDPFTTFSRTINVSSATSGKLSFQNDGGDNVGALLDNVVLSINPSPSVISVPEPSEIVGTLFCGIISSGYLLQRKGRRVD